MSVNLCWWFFALISPLYLLLVHYQPQIYHDTFYFDQSIYSSMQETTISIVIFLVMFAF
jgi:hypothetical protein